ncbi:hypothetical protein IJI89_00910 [Candidatus Saccharibacteria bacterium]|nr:hypothetical protein [Candidatus Saccharibacteria bacterium]
MAPGGALVVIPKVAFIVPFCNGVIDDIILGVATTKGFFAFTFVALDFGEEFAILLPRPDSDVLAMAATAVRNPRSKK